MKVTTLAGNLIARYGTNDPFAIANALGVKVVYRPLMEMRGHYSNIRGVPMITLADDLLPITARFVCGHELGHHIKHGHLNRPFMDSRTFMVPDKYENEADSFAYCLTFPMYERYVDAEQVTVWDMADCLNVEAVRVENRLFEIGQY
ncbi:MAG: ImmA/IrrE family metallo-endopeptidase [Oscillospiraceae bacterium]